MAPQSYYWGCEVAHTNLSFSPFLQAEKLNIKVHIHYPRLWNSLQEWFINIDTTKAQVYFVFEHKNFLQEATPMDLTIKINDVLVRLVIPESNRMYYIVKRIDAHKRFYELDGIKLQISLSDTFDKR
ncbi:unnamed protein product [Rotaria sp. Silwood1]|nr:unnamed protein product [Rotaria sp. Silwood1]